MDTHTCKQNGTVLKNISHFVSHPRGKPPLTLTVRRWCIIHHFRNILKTERHRIGEQYILIPITTPFGVIRPWRMLDAEALTRYANNRNVWMNMRDGFPNPYTLEDANSFLEIAIHQNPVTLCAIATQQEAIGGIGITINKDVHRLTAELGYWLAEPYLGKGIMTDAVIKFTEYAFESFGLVRIYAEPYANNKGSFRVLEKAGFMLEGQMQCSVIKEGKINDQLLYAKIKNKIT